MAILKPYATATYVDIPLVSVGSTSFVTASGYSYIAGDVKISLDGAAVNNITNNPTGVASGNASFWRFQLTAAETTAKTVMVTLVDASSGKSVEDTAFAVETYGHESSQHPQIGPLSVLIYSQVTSPSITADKYNTTLSGYTAGQLARRLIKFLSGQCANEQVLVTSYSTVSGTITSAPSLTTAPSSGDRFVIL